MTTSSSLRMGADRMPYFFLRSLERVAESILCLRWEGAAKWAFLDFLLLLVTSTCRDNRSRREGADIGKNTGRGIGKVDRRMDSTERSTNEATGSKGAHKFESSATHSPTTTAGSSEASMMRAPTLFPQLEHDVWPLQPIPPEISLGLPSLPLWRLSPSKSPKCYLFNL
ncbi:unnamed protein product [Sphagnum balticum]